MSKKSRIPANHDHAGFVAFLSAFLRFLRGNSRGAATVENVVLLGVAVTGAAGFNELGDKLHDQLDREAAHIRGEGMPGNASGDLGDLGSHFDAPEAACPGGVCSNGSPPCATCAGDPVAGTPGGAGTPTGPTAPVAGATPAVLGVGLTAGFTQEQQELEAECREALDATDEDDYIPLKKEDRKGPQWRPPRRDAILVICQETVEQCKGTVSADACRERWKCVYELVARQRTSGYFVSPKSKKDIQERCEDPNRQLTQWACRMDDPNPPVNPPTAITPPTPACNPCTKQERIDQSEKVGELAAKSFQEANFPVPPFECHTWNGAYVFDTVCVNSETREVVIIEAKGRSRPNTDDLGDRKGLDGKYVQQGTKDYALSVADVMSRNGSGDRREIATWVQYAIENQQLRYFEVRQPWSAPAGGTATAGTMEINEFDVDNPDQACPNCKCTP